MSSILKVDQLQDSGGNAIITSDGSGNLTAGTIPTTVIGTGAVLQVVNSSNGGDGTSTTSTSYTDTVNSLNITPISSNSKIVVFADHGLAITGGQSDARVDVRLRETITGVTISDKRYLGKNGTSGSTPINPQVGLTGVFTNSSTAQKNFKVQIRKADGNANSSGAIFLNWYTNALHNMVAMEIAQ